MIPALPAEPSSLGALRADLEAWRPALAAVAARHGLAGAPRPAGSGSLPVFLFDDAAVKLYAPDRVWRPEAGAGCSDWEVERGLLGAVEDAPAILGEGTLGDWRYLAMSRVPGAPIESLLPALGEPPRLAALRQLGARVRALHALPPPALPYAVRDFDAFLADQARDVARIERDRGAPEAWAAQLDGYVRRVPRGDARPVLLHTELGPGHALAEPAEGAVVFRGFIDFVDAMPGDAEYDLAAIAFFVTRGDGLALGAFLDGYGWEGPRGAALALRLMRYLLLHRFAPLRWLLERRPPGDARTLEALAHRWMGLAE